MRLGSRLNGHGFDPIERGCGVSWISPRRPHAKPRPVDAAFPSPFFDQCRNGSRRRSSSDNRFKDRVHGLAFDKHPKNRVAAKWHWNKLNVRPETFDQSGVSRIQCGGVIHEQDIGSGAYAGLHVVPVEFKLRGLIDPAGLERNLDRIDRELRTNGKHRFSAKRAAIEQRGVSAHARSISDDARAFASFPKERDRRRKIGRLIPVVS